jgi:hypothetical protein
MLVNMSAVGIEEATGSADHPPTGDVSRQNLG